MGRVFKVMAKITTAEDAISLIKDGFVGVLLIKPSFSFVVFDWFAVSLIIKLF